MSKVLLVGLDGATFDIIQPLAANGRLPTLAALLKQGAWGTLHSTIPPITPTAWTTAFTGKNPGKHGIYDFQEMDRHSYARRPVHVDRHREKTVWDLLGEAGLPSIVLDVPFTYPPRPLHGLMITGYGTPRLPGTVFSYPATLAEELPPAVRDQVRIALPHHDFDRSRAFLGEWREIMNGRRRLIHHLMTEREWAFFFTVFSITDNLAHVFWTYLEPTHPNYHRSEGAEYREALFDAYIQCDALLGEMLTWAGPETVTLIMSDHGFGSVYPRQYLFRRLADGRFLQYQSARGLGGLRNQLLRLAMHTYTGLPFLRQWIKNLRPQGQQAVKAGLERAGLLPDDDALDSARSLVLPSSFGLQLWLNRQDRFPNGAIPPEDVAHLIEKLSDYLLADADAATGQPIIARVYRGSDLYHGPAAALGPDLVIEQRNFYRPDAVPTPVNPYLEGSHTHDAIFLAHGIAIQPGPLSATPTLADLMPTILYLLEQPIPPDVDGRVLTQIMADFFRAAHPIRIGDAPARHEAIPGVPSDLTPAEEAEINKQLRQLGYL